MRRAAAAPKSKSEPWQKEWEAAEEAAKEMLVGRARAAAPPRRSTGQVESALLKRIGEVEKAVRSDIAALDGRILAVADSLVSTVARGPCCERS